MNTAHIQCYSCEVSCKHCGLAPTLDAMSAVALVDVVRGFLLMHRHCEKPAEVSKQVELFDALAQKEPENPNGFGRPGHATYVDPTTFGIEPGTDYAAYAIDGSSDEPDPETDPPPRRHGPGPAMDPIELRHAITCVRPKEFWPTVKAVASWHPEVRADVQRWCRIEHILAHPVEGMTLPQREQMPNVLENIEHEKAKRGARPLSSGPKKRRSGSTANSP